MSASSPQQGCQVGEFPSNSSTILGPFHSIPSKLIPFSHLPTNTPNKKDTIAFNTLSKILNNALDVSTYTQTPTNSFNRLPKSSNTTPLDKELFHHPLDTSDEFTIVRFEDLKKITGALGITITEKNFFPTSQRDLVEVRQGDHNISESEDEYVGNTGTSVQFPTIVPSPLTSKHSLPPSPHTISVSPTQSSQEQTQRSQTPSQQKQNTDGFVYPKRRIPPINLVGSQHTDTIAHIEALFPNTFNATVKGDHISIKAFTLPHFRKIRDYFEQESIHYYTYLPPEDKTLKVVFKGIPLDWSTDTLVSLLKEMQYPIIRATRLNKGQHRCPIRVVLVELPKSNSNNNIHNIKKIGGLDIVVEKFLAGGISQCHRCQNFRHAQSECRLEPRCVKCAGAHLTRVCKKPWEETPKCANCAGPHTANFRKCPVFLEQSSKKRALLPTPSSQPFAGAFFNFAPTYSNSQGQTHSDSYNQKSQIPPRFQNTQQSSLIKSHNTNSPQITPLTIDFQKISNLIAQSVSEIISKTLTQPSPITHQHAE